MAEFRVCPNGHRLSEWWVQSFCLRCDYEGGIAKLKAIVAGWSPDVASNVASEPNVATDVASNVASEPNVATDVASNVASEPNVATDVATCEQCSQRSVATGRKVCAACRQRAYRDRIPRIDA